MSVPQSSKIRHLTREWVDYVAYTHLLNQLVPTENPISLISYQNQIDSLVYNLPECSHIYVSEQNDQIVGTIKVIIERKLYKENCYVAHIEDVITDQSVRGQGIGQHLVQFAINLAKEKGCYKLVLTCKDSYIAFYGKCGFKVENNNMCLRIA
jgi:predicted GNAT family N-acyltransferase